MPDGEYRGTTLDPAWDPENLTGGNDSGAAADLDEEKLDRATGPDLTARMLDSDGTPMAGEDTDAPTDLPIPPSADAPNKTSP